MHPSQITYTQQLDWKFENHGHGAVAVAAKKIVNGEIVSFTVYNRDNKNDSCALTYKGTHYFGIMDLPGDGPAFRTSSAPSLHAEGSHSLIPTWYGNDIVSDPAHVAARLMMFLMREGSDCFINE